MSSVQFQEFQALQALAGSDSPNALAGIYTLLLQTMHQTSRRDPVHPLLLCIPLRRFMSVSCMPVVYDALAPRLTPSDYVWAFCRASLMSKRWHANGQALLSFRISRARTDGQSQWSQAYAPLNNNVCVPIAQVLAHRQTSRRVH